MLTVFHTLRMSIIITADVRLMKLRKEGFLREQVVLLEPLEASHVLICLGSLPPNQFSESSGGGVEELLLKMYELVEPGLKEVAGPGELKRVFEL